MTKIAKAAKVLEKGDGADCDDPETEDRPVGAARAIPPTLGGSRLQFLREQAERDREAARPALDMVAELSAAAEGRGDIEAVQLCVAATLAIHRGDQPNLLKALAVIQERARPASKVGADDRELLIEATAKLGVDAATEALRRAKVYGRRK